MLTVVAIIAVLVAISIPIINSSLEKAQVTTDQANERAAKGVLLTEYLLAENAGGGSELFFDNAAGKWTGTPPTAYGKCEEHQGCYLKGKISDSGVVEMIWTDGVAKSEPPHSGESLSDNSGGGGIIPPASVVPVGLPKDYGDFTVYGTFQGQDLDETVTFTSTNETSGVLRIKNDKQIIISNKSNVDQTKRHRIEVANGVSANIVLKDVNIDVNGQINPAFQIVDNSKGNVTITLEGTNTLKGGNYCAGLQKNGNIAGIGTLTITGTGTLVAAGGEYGAGIGSRQYENSDNIIISGGTVSANGGRNAAGIGGGASARSYGGGVGSNITISGGTVRAAGGVCGAGIGGGNVRSGTKITISGGTVIATGGGYAAGIGGGNEEAGYNITISGGTVSANGGVYGAGIGGANGGYGRDITISGGIVRAAGGERGAGIGGGSGKGQGITISGGMVTANGGRFAAGIGGGYGAGQDIKISGSMVTANGGERGAGIGGSAYLDGSNITISNNSDVTATGNSGGAGIGGGGGDSSYSGGSGKDITISNSTVTAAGQSNGCDIGYGSYGSTYSNITVNGNAYTPKKNTTTKITPKDPPPATP